MRKEIKYIINLQEFNSLKNILDKTIEKDIHTNEYGEYSVKTIYFENYLRETAINKINNINNISKYRIRMYQNDVNAIFLGRKTNINGNIQKENEKIQRKIVEQLLKGDYYYLLDSNSNLKNTLYLKMALKQYRPFIIIEYDRKAYFDKTSNTRITMDRNIKSTFNCNSFFKETKQEKFSNEIILEIKYEKYIPEYIKDILKILDKNQISNSKYINEILKYGI